MANIEMLSNFDTVFTLVLSTTMQNFGELFDHFYGIGGKDLPKHSLKFSINYPFITLKGILG